MVQNLPFLISKSSIDMKCVLFFTLWFCIQSAFAQLILTPPVPDIACKSDTGIFIVGVVTNTSLEWQVSTDSIQGPWTVPTVGVTGVNTTELKVTQPEIYAGSFFRVVVRDLNGVLPNDTSFSVWLTVFNDATPAIVSVPGGFAFCEDSSILIKTDSTYSTYSWGPLGESTPTISVMSGGMYTVTVTDINGCTGSSSSQVIQWPSPTPQILPAGTEVKFCPGKSLQLMCDSLVYSQYAWSNPPGGTGASITVTSEGVYSLTVTDTHGCQASTSRVVGVFSSASPPTIDPPNKEFCKGDSLLLVGSSGYSSYAWSTGATGASLFVSNEATYILTVTDGNGCTASTNASVNENPLPKPDFSTFPEGLSGSSIAFTTEPTFTDISTSLESPIAMWNWDFGAGAVPPFGTMTVPHESINVHYTFDGLKKVCLETIDQKSCSQKKCIEFLVNPANGPIVTLTPYGQMPDCLSDTFWIQATVISDDPINDYLRQYVVWDYDPSLILLIDTKFISGSASTLVERACFIFLKQGTATIYATALQIDNNTPTDTLPGTNFYTITSGNLVPTYTIVQQPAFLCQGEIGTISLKVTPAEDGKIEYSQNGMNTISLPFTNGNISIPVDDTDSPGIVEVIIQRIYIGDCRSELGDKINIEIRNIPEVLITGPDVVCVNELAYLVAQGAESYEWKINNSPVLPVTIDTLPIQSDIPGSYNYSIVGNLNGCFDSDTFMLLVPDPLLPEIFGDSLVCKDQVVVYSSQDPIPDHIWTITGGSALSQNQDSVRIRWQTVGQWPLVLTQNIGKCTGESTETITVSDNNSPPYNTLVWLKGGRILLYPNPDEIPGLCYQWYKDGMLLPGETYQGYVVPVGVSDNQLTTYSVKVWYCVDGDACAQSIVYRSPGSPPEEAEPRFQIVPNPNSGTFFVEYDGLNPGHYVQHIINASGGMINEQELDIADRSGSLPVLISNLSAAIYFVRWVNTTTGDVLITQIIVLP